jgi:raffinose/stachyose/melibiose transport system permease protein
MVFIFIVLAVMIVPFGWMILSSFKSNIEFFSNPFGLPAHWSLDNYSAVFADQPMALYLFHSAVTSIGSTILAVAIASMAAYALQYRFRVQNSAYIFLIFGLFVPVSALLTQYYFIVTWLHLFDTLWGLLLVYAGMSIPMSLLIIKSYMDSIPREILEASYIDGASYHRRFFSMVVPLTVPGIMTAGIFLTIISWNELLFANLLTESDNSRTVQVAIRFFLASFHANYPEAFAAMLVAIVPTIVAYVFLSRWIVAGLTAGAVK